METKFIDGLRVYKPNDKAPDFIKLDGKISLDELNEWAAKEGLTEISFQVKESKKGSYYAALNTWKAQPTENTTPEIEYPDSTISPDDIPFN